MIPGSNTPQIPLHGATLLNMNWGFHLNWERLSEIQVHPTTPLGKAEGIGRPNSERTAWFAKREEQINRFIETLGTVDCLSQYYILFQWYNGNNSDCSLKRFSTEVPLVCYAPSEAVEVKELWSHSVNSQHHYIFPYLSSSVLFSAFHSPALSHSLGKQTSGDFPQV